MSNIELYAKSKCCNAKIKIIGRKNPHAECTKCGKICNTVNVFNLEKGEILK